MVVGLERAQQSGGEWDCWQDLDHDLSLSQHLLYPLEILEVTLAYLFHRIQHPVTLMPHQIHRSRDPRAKQPHKLKIPQHGPILILYSTSPLNLKSHIILVILH